MDIQLQCGCGKLRGVIKDVDPAKSRHLVCLCDDCQAYVHHLGQARRILDANGGTEILPVAPASLKITQGREQLRCVRLSEKGMMRWYAGCCRTPIANTAPTQSMPYAGVLRVIMNDEGDPKKLDQALGPIRYRLMGKFGIGSKPPGTHEGMSPLAFLQIGQFMLGAFLRRRHVPSPFFDQDSGRPLVEPSILSIDQREQLRPLCGPMVRKSSAQ